VYKFPGFFLKKTCRSYTKTLRHDVCLRVVTQCFHIDNIAAIFYLTENVFMKKGISLVAVLIMSSAIALYGKKISFMIYEKPATKTVEFSVYAGSDYSASLYKKSKARVVLTVYKYAGESREVVWEGNIDEGNIKNYPMLYRPLIRKVSIHNVLESRETLVAAYRVIYDSRESNLSYEDGVILSKGSTSDTLAVKI
jgi:hypothetical protein